MNNRTVFIILFTLECLALNAQRIITGTVRSVADWTPIPRVTVLIKGTTIGTLTDEDGNYSITLLDGQSTLIFRYPGFISQEIPVASSSILNIALQKDSHTDPYFDLKGLGFLQYGILSGLNHSPYGLQLKAHVKGSRDRRLDLTANFQYQFGYGNSNRSFRIGRNNNWPLFGKWTDLNLELKKREIRNADFSQMIREFAVINSFRLRNHELGIGIGVQMDYQTEIPEESMAFVGEWGHHFHFSGQWYAGIRLKKWTDNTQLGWKVHHYLSHLNLLLQISGQHLSLYNEVTIGLSHDFNFR